MRICSAWYISSQMHEFSCNFSIAWENAPNLTPRRTFEISLPIMLSIAFSAVWNVSLDFNVILRVLSYTKGQNSNCLTGSRACLSHLISKFEYLWKYDFPKIQLQISLVFTKSATFLSFTTWNCFIWKYSWGSICTFFLEKCFIKLTREPIFLQFK